MCHWGVSRATQSAGSPGKFLHFSSVLNRLSVSTVRLLKKGSRVVFFGHVLTSRVYLLQLWQPAPPSFCIFPSTTSQVVKEEPH